MLCLGTRLLVNSNKKAQHRLGEGGVKRSPGREQAPITAKLSGG